MIFNSHHFTLQRHDNNIYRVCIKDTWFNSKSCIVICMYQLIYEALALAKEHRRVMRFKYLGRTFNVWSALTAESLVKEMVRLRTQKFLRDSQYASPSFLTTTTWLENVRTFYQGDTTQAIPLAIKFGVVLTVVSKREFRIKRNLDAILTRYWSLIVFYSSQKDIEDALVILSLAWKKDSIGELVYDWRADQIIKVNAKLGLTVSDQGISIVTKASNE